MSHFRKALDVFLSVLPHLFILFIMQTMDSINAPFTDKINQRINVDEEEDNVYSIINDFKQLLTINMLWINELVLELATSMLTNE